MNAAIVGAPVVAALAIAAFWRPSVVVFFFLVPFALRLAADLAVIYKIRQKAADDPTRLEVPRRKKRR